MNKKFILTAALAVVLSFLFISQARAGLDLGTSYVSNLGLGTQDLRTTVAGIIRNALAFLGVVAVVVILYGGFVWMTAGGDSGKVDSAKNILKNGSIGLGIILSAYAITTFVFSVLLGGTTGGGVLTGGGSGTGGTGGDGGTTTENILRGCPDPNPNDPSPYICKLKKNTSPVGSMLTVQGGLGGVTVNPDGTISKVPGSVYFVTLDYVEDPNASALILSEEILLQKFTDAACEAAPDKCLKAQIQSCGTESTWEDNEVVVEVPDLSALGSEYYVVVKSKLFGEADGLSIEKDTRKKNTQGVIDLSLRRNDRFTLASGTPGPGIICLLPNSGKVGDPIRILGKRFGDVDGVDSFITFASNIQTDSSTTDERGDIISSWTDTEIKTYVPAGAQTGDLSVTSLGRESDNDKFFKITCPYADKTRTSECVTGCCSSNMCVSARYCRGQEGDSCTTDSDCDDGLMCSTDGRCVPVEPPEAGEACGVIEQNFCSNQVTCAVGNICNTNPNSSAFCTCDPIPVILDVEPKDGAPGSFVTIYGLNFGIYGANSKIEFLGDPNISSDDKVAVPPETCGPPSGLWLTGSVLVEIPEGAVDGPIRITTNGGQSDSTLNSNTQGIVMNALPNEEDGEFYGFDVNEVKRPKLCYLTSAEDESFSIMLSEGYFGDKVNFVGAELSVTSAESDPYISGSRLPGAFSIATVPNSELQVLKGASVPNLKPLNSPYRAQVKVGDLYSNTVPFLVRPTDELPHIDYIDITRGPKGQYVSVFGGGFGSTPGTLTFDPEFGDTVTGAGTGLLFDFPQTCSLDSVWTNSNIIFTVPKDDSIRAGQASIRVTNNIGLSNPEEQDAIFEICDLSTDCQLTPGICAIEPNQGPAGTRVRIFGSGFGDYVESISNVIFYNTQTAVKNSINLSSIADYWAKDFVGKGIDNNDPDGVFVSVPSAAVSGPVYLETAQEVPDGDDEDTLPDLTSVNSSSVNFIVSDCRSESICSQAEVCCAFSGICMTEEQAKLNCKPSRIDPSKLAYEYQTGIAGTAPGIPMVLEDATCEPGPQSPSPFKSSTGNCKNAVISARFVNKDGVDVPMPTDRPITDVNNISFNEHFNENTIIVVNCGTANDFDIANCQLDASGLPSDPATRVSAAANGIRPVAAHNSADVAGFEYIPAQELPLNTWFLVKLISGPSAIRSEAGLWLDGNRNGLPEVDDHYQYAFKTGNDPIACAVSRVNILPDRIVANVINQEVTYTATAMAQNCNILNAYGFNWDWYSKKQDGSSACPASGEQIACITNSDLAPAEALDNRQDPTQIATTKGQGIAFIGAQAYQDVDDTEAVDYQPIVPKDDNNRLIVDLNIPFIETIFHDNGLIHPLVDSIVTITGYNFGDSKANSKVFFGDAEASLAQCVNSWNDTRIQVVAPKPAVTLGDGLPVFDADTADGTFRGELGDNNAKFAYTFNTSSKVEAFDIVGSLSGVIEKGDNTPSFAGGAISLAGDGYIQIPSDDLDMNEGALEFWFFLPIIENQGNSLANDEVLVSAGDLEIKVNTDLSLSIQPDNFVTESSAISLDEWHHLVYSVEGDARRVYLDGMVIAPSTGGSTATYFMDDVSSSDFIYFGGAPAINGLFGLIDNVAVYSSPLSVESVMKHAGIRTAKTSLLKVSFDGDTPAFSDVSVQSEFINSNSWPAKTEGYFGQASNFIDDASGYTYGEAKNSKIYNSLDGLSVVTWVKDLSLTTPSRIISSSLDGGIALEVGTQTVCGTGYNLCFSANLLVDGDEREVFSRVDLNSSSVDYTADEWNLIVGVLDLKNGVIKLYVNGGSYDENDNAVKPNHSFSFSNQDSEILITTKNPSAPVCIGAAPTLGTDGVLSCGSANETTDRALNGKLDQLQVYNYALSEKAIGDLSGVLETSSVYVATNGGTTKDDKTHIFKKSENIYPFLCKLTPSSGPAGTNAIATGVNFGSGRTVNFEGRDFSLNSNLFYDTIKLASIRFAAWANNLVSFSNPFGDQPVPKRDVSISIDPYSEPFDDKNDDAIRDTGEDYVDAQTKRLGTSNAEYTKATYTSDNNVIEQSLVSNTQPFYFAPVITALSPDNGPVGQWVTVIGYNFGERRDAFTDELIPGKVYFTGATGLIEARLVVDSCTGEYSWTNNAIIVEVPQGAVIGPVIVESAGDGTPESKLQSNGWRFTVNEKPLGPGISCLKPNTILKGENVLIKGVRFGATGDANNVKVDGTQNLGSLIGPWSDALNVETDENLSYGSHIVQVVQKAKIGESCAGFSIGTFCPGGRVDVIDDVPSNGLPLTITQICQDGLLTQAKGVSGGWPQVVKNPANNTIIPTGLTATDGDYVYTLSNNIIYRMGTGLGGTTRGQVTKFDLESGDAITNAKSFFFTQENLYTNLDHDSLYKITLDTETNKFTTLSVNTANLYEADWGGDTTNSTNLKYFVTSNGNQVVNVSYASSAGIGKKRVEQTGDRDVEVKVGEQNVGTCTSQTSPACSVSDGCEGFLCNRYDEISSVDAACTYSDTCSRKGACSVYYWYGGCKTYKTEYYTCDKSSTITTTNKSCIKFIYETRKEPIYSTVDSYAGFNIQILNPASNFSKTTEFFVRDSADFTQAKLLGAVADTKYIYLLSESGKVRLIDIATGDFAKISGTNSNLEWNSETQKESNGQFDIKTGNFYLGTYDNSGNIYRYRGCDFGQSCQTNADCNACGLGTSACVAGVCTPVIKEVTPAAAAVGQYVTVKGCYLDGDSREVCFSKADAPAGVDCSANFIPASDVPASICGALEQRDDYIVVEVPLLDQPNNSTTNDAQDGPIQVVVNTTDRDGNAIKLTTQSFDTTSVTPTQAEIDSISPYYSFGVKDFDVNNSITQPSVCSLTPNEGDIGALVEIRGKGFGESKTENVDEVTFKGDATSILDDQVAGTYFVTNSSDTSVADSSGNGRTGTMDASDSFVWEQPGYVPAPAAGGTPYVLTTDVSQQGWINFGNSTDYDFGTGKSLEFWVKRSTTASGYWRLFSKRGGSGTNTGWWLDISSTDKLSLNWGNVDTKTSTASIADTEWHHIVVTISAIGVPTFYIDNVKEVKSAFAKNINPSTSDFIMGALQDLNGNPSQWAPADWSIDQVVFYNTVLADQDVSYRYNAGAGRAEIAGGNITGLWRLDYGGGDVGTCQGTNSGWSENLICTYVPQRATTGAVEVTNDDIESANGIPFTVYETIKGPQKASSVPEMGAESVCTNSVIEITFTGTLDESTLNSNLSIDKCEEKSQTLAKGFGGKLVNFIKGVKDLLLHGTFAQNSNYIDCKWNIAIESITTRYAGGNTVVNIKPKLFLDGGSLFRVNIGDGIKDTSGVSINKEISVHTDGTRVERSLSERVVRNLQDVTSTGVSLDLEKDKVSVKDILARSNGEKIKISDIVLGTSADTATVERAYYGYMGGNISKDEDMMVDDDFTFSTKGVSGQLNSGVCNFDDVEISVYNDSNSSGNIASKDFFVCAGDNCRLPFDYDQAPGPLGDGPSYDLNQHRYVARATSAVNESTTFVDQFERTQLSQGDNSFIQFTCPNFSISNGKLESSGGCLAGSGVLISNASATLPRLFPRGTATKIEVELNSSAQDYGVYIGGNYVYRANISGELRYVARNAFGSMWVSDAVPNFPTYSRWEAILINGQVQLVVDGQKVLPNNDKAFSNPSIVFNNNGYHGLFSASANKVIWDNFRLTVESYNVLKGKYTWSRSEQLDPLKLVTLLPQIKGGANQDLLPDDKDKVQSEGGEVYSQIEPITTGQTKIVVEASTDAGQQSNTVSKELPINVFICENPWPDYNKQFTDSALNFLTYYCRDVGDAKDPVGNLPPAGTIQRCDYKAGDNTYNEAQCEDYEGIPRSCSEAGVCYPPIR